jgi:DNA invertase Pin-like site-specific DNA recombinase
MVRQILGAVSQFEKAMLVAKLKGARERKRAATGKCEGRKTYAERSPQMVTPAKRLHRYTIDKRQRSLRDIAKANAKVVPSKRPPLFSSTGGVVPLPLAGLPVDLLRAPVPGVLRIYRQPSIGDD